MGPTPMVDSYQYVLKLLRRSLHYKLLHIRRCINTGWLQLLSTISLRTGRLAVDIDIHGDIHGYIHVDLHGYIHVDLHGWILRFWLYPWISWIFISKALLCKY